MSEADLYSMLQKFEFMYNVVDCQVQVLLERQKSYDEGQWINPGKAKRDEQDRRRLQRSVDAKTFKKQA